MLLQNCLSVHAALGAIALVGTFEAHQNLVRPPRHLYLLFLFTIIVPNDFLINNTTNGVLQDCSSLSISVSEVIPVTARMSDSRLL